MQSPPVAVVARPTGRARAVVVGTVTTAVAVTERAGQRRARRL